MSATPTPTARPSGLTSEQTQLLALINGFRSTQVVYVIAKLGLADLLANGAATAEELASASGVDASNLYRVLRLATFFGLTAEEAGGRFSLTTLGDGLRSDVRGSSRGMAIMLGEEHYGAWGSLLHSVTTGESAFARVYGSPMFDYLLAHPESQAVFDAAMAAGTGLYLAALTEIYDFSGFRRIVDVGGGNGSVAATILDRNPNATAVVYDQAQLRAAAERYLQSSGVSDRGRFEPGNFFESVPAGGDLYLLSTIVHDWDDERALKILRNCRAAMDARAVLILLEAVMQPHGHPSTASLSDVNMMVVLTGRERTEEEFRALLAAAGFELKQISPFLERRCLLEARPV